MKQALVLCLAIAFMMACNNKADNKEVETDTVQVLPASAWVATLNDSTGKLEMVKSENSGPESLTDSAVVRYINTLNPSIKLVYSKTSGDTIFIKIPEATYLTQQMGSTGSIMFMSAAVYNLTEIPGIKLVNFDFEEGDHAAPGNYSRESFKNE